MLMYVWSYRLHWCNISLFTCDKYKTTIVLFKEKTASVSANVNKSTVNKRLKNPRSYRKNFLYLEFILVQYSMHQQRWPSSFLPFGRLCVTLNYQRHVLLMAAKFGQQNGAYVYFVGRIKRNLRRSQLVCKPQPFSANYKCCQHIKQYIYSFIYGSHCAYFNLRSPMYSTTLWTEILLPDIWILRCA